MKSSWLRLFGGVALVAIAVLLSMTGCSANSAPGEQLVTRAPDASVALAGIRMIATGNLSADHEKVDVTISVAKYADPSRELARVQTSVAIGSTEDVSTGENAGSDTFKISVAQKGDDVVVTIYSRINDNGRISQPSVRFLAKEQGS